MVESGLELELLKHPIGPRGVLIREFDSLRDFVDDFYTLESGDRVDYLIRGNYLVTLTQRVVDNNLPFFAPIILEPLTEERYGERVVLLSGLSHDAAFGFDNYFIGRLGHSYSDFKSKNVFCDLTNVHLEVTKGEPENHSIILSGFDYISNSRSGINN